MTRPKLALLRGATRRGPAALARQAGLILADTLLRKKHLVFRLEAADLPPPGSTQDLTFREIGSLDELHPEDRALLTAPDCPIPWGGADWFERGWRLWIAETNGRLAALGWWRSAEQSRDFFVPLPPDGELLWHATVLPAHQGHNLHSVLRLTLMHWRAREGIRSFFTNCRDYNTPSYRNILRMGFQPIGYCIERRGSRRTWHPARETEMSKP